MSAMNKTGEPKSSLVCCAALVALAAGLSGLAGGRPAAVAAAAADEPAPPIHSDFHGASAEQMQNGFEYWVGKKGLHLATRCAYMEGGEVKFAGSFQRGPGATAARAMMDEAACDKFEKQYAAEGLRPRQVSVVSTKDGPRFSVIWMKTEADYRFYRGVPGEQMDAKVKEMAAAGFVIEDLAGYVDSPARPNTPGAPKFAAVFVKDKKGAPDPIVRLNMGEDEFKKANEQAPDGYRLTRYVEHFKGGAVALDDNGGGDRMYANLGPARSAVWEKAPGEWANAQGMDGEAYQKKHDEMGKKGFRLYFIDRGDHSSHFSAIWVKP